MLFFFWLFVVFVGCLTKTAVSFSHPNLHRRAFLEKVPGIIAGASLMDSNPLPSLAEDVGKNQVLPSQNPGIIWHAAQRRALPAIPATLQRLIHTEWFGGTSNAPSSGIVCISERHDDFEHHLVQLRCLRSLHKALSEDNTRSGLLTVGMECFQRNHQIFLDKFIRSPEYSLNDLQRDTNWDTTWGYDLLHYAPLLTYAKSKGVRIYGIHPTQEQVEQVLADGIEAVPTSLLQGVTTNNQPEQKHYQQYKRKLGITDETMARSPSIKAHFDRWYLVQRFREEYMAESVAKMVHKYHYHSRTSGTSHWTAVLAGENHILGREGIPSRALRRASAKDEAFSGNSSTSRPSRGVYTILPKTASFPIVACDAPTRLQADYVWFVENESLKPNQVNLSPFHAA